MTIDVTKETFAAEVEQSDKPVIVDFWAAWCGPCKMLGPVIEELSEENPDIKVCKVNVDEQKELAARFNVMSIPTIIAFKDGEPVEQTVGFTSKEDLLKLVQ